MHKLTRCYKNSSLISVYSVYSVVKTILATPSNIGRRPAMRITEALEAYDTMCPSSIRNPFKSLLANRLDHKRNAELP